MKKLLAAALAAAMLLSLVACGGNTAADTAPAAAPETQNESTAGPETQAEPTPEPTEAPTDDQADEVYVAETPLRVAGMQGPTTMGLANLFEASQTGGDVGSLTFEIDTDANAIVPLIVRGELDAAAVPANLAATLYQKTQGAVQVACVNTLGVLYVLEKGESIQSVADLTGKTVLCPGKGTTPEYVLRYVLQQNGRDPDGDAVHIEYKSEAAEVMNDFVAAEDLNIVALLPQPAATTALSKAGGAREALDMTAEWDKVADGKLVTGVLVVRKAAIEADPARFDQFLKDYQDSVAYANSDPETTAALCEKFGIVPQAALAEKALPKCNLVFETGEEMKADLSGYLQVLYDADPDSVGGAMPDDDFYYGV